MLISTDMHSVYQAVFKSDFDGKHHGIESIVFSEGDRLNELVAREELWRLASVKGFKPVQLICFKKNKVIVP